MSSLSFLGLLIYASVVYHQFRTGSLRGYVQTSNPEGHNLVANTGYPSYPGAAVGTKYPAQQEDLHEYPKATYYDGQAVAQAQAYGGQGYEPYSHQSTMPAHEQAQGLVQPQQQGYEMNQRSAV